MTAGGIPIVARVLLAVGLVVVVFLSGCQQEVLSEEYRLLGGVPRPRANPGIPITGQVRPTMPAPKRTRTRSFWDKLGDLFSPASQEPERKRTSPALHRAGAPLQHNRASRTYTVTTPDGRAVTGRLQTDPTP